MSNAEVANVAAGVFRIIDVLADWHSRRRGWRRIILAFCYGAVATLALPPLNFSPVLCIVFPALIWMLGGAATKKQAFWVGWAFGFGFFVIGLYWIGNALLVFAAQFAWMLPAVNLGLPAGMAVYAGLALLVAFFGRSNLERALLLSVGWVVAEWLRGHAFTGFPWNLVGYAWAGSDALIQAASVVGAYGLSALVMLSVCSLAAVAHQTLRIRIAVLLVAVTLPVAVWVGGSWRLADTEISYTPGIGLRVVQANIPQIEKWAREFQGRNFQKHLRLSVENRPDWVTHIIWPEMAATFPIQQNEEWRIQMAGIVPANGLLVTGGPRWTFDKTPGASAQNDKPDDRIGGARIHNSAIAVNQNGDIAGTYDKFHLVPFGEYVPLRDYLPLNKITHGSLGYTPGPGPETLNLPGLPPVGPLICYEVIFPGNATEQGNSPDWLLNLTNDAWYGRSAGPYQHLAISRLRSVEEGVPMVRAAYTGISAIVDPYGRVLQSLGLSVEGYLDVRLPTALRDKPIYANYGDWSTAFLLVIIGGFWVISRRLPY